jgi:hypothetical protein
VNRRPWEDRGSLETRCRVIDCLRSDPFSVNESNQGQSIDAFVSGKLIGISVAPGKAGGTPIWV